MPMQPNKVTVYTVSGSISEPLGVAEIRKNESKAIIEVDFKTPTGKQLLEFWETYPEMIGITFMAREAAALIPKQGEKTDGK